MLMLHAAEQASTLATKASDPEVQRQLDDLADSLMSTKHDIVHELSELDDLNTDAKARALDRIERWINEDLDAWQRIGASISETDLVEQPEAIQLVVTYVELSSTFLEARDAATK
jgi:L-lactate utilization protein LutB